MTFGKVTPATKLVNEKKLSQAQMTPWHVPSSIWVHLGPWGSIFLVKNQFSHIFPASAWSPYQSLFLRYEVEKGLRAVYSQVSARAERPRRACGEIQKQIGKQILWRNTKQILVKLQLHLQARFLLSSPPTFGG